MPFVYVGRRHDFIGKSLWEIISSLKNFGIGRIVIRHRKQRYSEPCFMRIVSVEPVMDEEHLKGKVYVDYVFRGISRGITSMSRVAYKTDHQLIPKHEEYKYLKALEEFQLKDVRLFSPTAEMPPLLKLVAEKKGHHACVLKMALKDYNPRARIAKEGEIPNVFPSASLGTPACKELYEGVLEESVN